MGRILEDTFCEYTGIKKLSVSEAGLLAFIAVTADQHKNCYYNELYFLHHGIIHRSPISFPVLYNFCWQGNDVLICHAILTEEDLSLYRAGVVFSVLYSLDIRSGEVREYARLPYEILSFFAAEDGSFVLSVKLDQKIKQLYEECKGQFNPYADMFLEEDFYFTADEIPFLSEGGLFTGNSRIVLCHYKDGGLQELTSLQETVCDFDVINSKTIWLITKEFTEMKSTYGKVSKYDLVTGTRIWYEDKVPLIYGGIKAVHEGKFIAACTDGRLHGIYQDYGIEIRDMDSGTIERLNQEAGLSLFCSMNTDINAPNGHYIRFCGDASKLYFVATVSGSSAIMEFDFQTKEIKRITEEPGVIKELIEHQGILYFIGAKGSEGFEIYQYNRTDGRQIVLTDFNKGLEDQFPAVKPESVQFINDSGDVIEGWVLKPSQYVEQEQYPAILSIHGGPNMAYGPNYIHELQFLCSMGYGVFYCNPRGSVGYGGFFADIRSSYFKKDCSDLLGFTDYVLSAHKWIDKNRIGVMGGSYGGIMTAWLAGHNTRFRAAAAERFSSDFISYFGTSEIGLAWMQDIFGATPWEDIEMYWDYSPLKYVQDVNIPVLVMLGYQDVTCPACTALEFFQALKFYGKESRLIVFKNENHALKLSGLPKTRILRLKEINAWFDRYLA